ncbi:hypothetical protein FVEN_g9858 [Fusarium venenatum]|uniref:Uncharacterized protein n=1 Tax=Fusarium venenatum TaxID=56646 RepID=A0A2L2T870_9HYPO|nr:uncharacterized protein FVRRES_03606 [Fusarium venenatum]KAG8352094.1 hypothetical protein FVEN_g9858 [Fusarium venenatum]KAH7003385.1 hypothetical protein EDB82DRAFT_14731 [Fusarium venenatum]CEI67094.1 unnamed protein product [Fusarium venenatum]
MVAIHALKALALMVITLPFVIQAVPAIPIGKSKEVESETRIPATDYLLEPSIPRTDGINQIIDVMKKDKEEKPSVSREAIIASNLNYFPWGRVDLNSEEYHLLDDDDESRDSETKSGDKSKRSIDDGVMVDETASNGAYETVHHKILDTNETTIANEPRYNRMELYTQRPTLLREDKTHKDVPQTEKAGSKQD